MSDLTIINQLLTIQCEELKAKLHTFTNESHQAVGQLKQHIKILESRQSELMSEACEWICPKCKNEYYGRTAVEVGNFKCLAQSCPNTSCIPRKYYKESQLVATNSEAA